MNKATSKEVKKSFEIELLDRIEFLIDKNKRLTDSNRELLSALDYLLRNFDSSKKSAGAIIKANAAINNAKNLNP